MKKQQIGLALTTALLLSGCFSGDTGNPIVSQKYVHKYGFDVSEEEWQQREQEGQIVSMLKNGVKVTASYENGLLNGSTTYTFPHSSVIEKLQVYAQGVLLKELLNDPAGIPISEDVYEFDDRRITTLWDEKGSPLSVEEYDGDLLVEGKYFTPDHELEGQVEAGFGERYKRDRLGALLSRDLIENGTVATRTNFHPNGLIHSISHYQNNQLQGEQKKFTSSGKPLMDLNWNHGVLDGLKITYRDGVKVAEVPYINGQKHGIETHYDDIGNLTAEIEWKNDKKHGLSRFFDSDSTEEEWFYKGAIVTQQRFEILSNRETLVADLSLDIE
jgi:antitoxin component YwqK of YwqJK toxin-antitoxin module